jgi:acetylxylan esterase
MYIYVPDKLATKPAVIVAIHHCQGTGTSYYQSTPYSKLADQYGFIVIYPESPYSGTCWDVSSKKSLTHNGGGNSNSIANMVTYTLQKYKGDATKVFVTGSSSGAMMTNVMAATYPELFKAATAYSGVPAGCFVSTANQEAAWNSTCAQGTVQASAQYWATTVKNMYPGYAGARPRFQVYHGSADTILRPQNYQETVKEWTGVFGFDATKPQKTQQNAVLANSKTDTWGVTAANPLGTVQGIYVTGAGHTVPVQGYVGSWGGVVLGVWMLTLFEQYSRHEVVRSGLDASYATGSLVGRWDWISNRSSNDGWIRFHVRRVLKLCGQSRRTVVVVHKICSQHYRIPPQGSCARLLFAKSYLSCYSTQIDPEDETNSERP